MSKVSVVSGLMYATHPVMVIDPCAIYGKPMRTLVPYMVSQCQSKKKIMGWTLICTDRQTDVQTKWFLFTPLTSFLRITQLTLSDCNSFPRFTRALGLQFVNRDLYNLFSRTARFLDFHKLFPRITIRSLVLHNLFFENARVPSRLLYLMKNKRFNHYFFSINSNTSTTCISF